MTVKAITLAALLTNGCLNPTSSAVEVRPGVWRSAQPTTDEQWRALYKLGVRRVVKLNFESEGSDDGAVRAGMVVYSLSIQPRGDEDIIDALNNTLVQPDAATIDRAEQIIDAGGGVLVHCTYGRDRTGLVIGISRLRVDGWTKQKAWSEMIAHGYRPELLGLTRFWIQYAP